MSAASLHMHCAAATLELCATAATGSGWRRLSVVQVQVQVLGCAGTPCVASVGN